MCLVDVDGHNEGYASAGKMSRPTSEIKAPNALSTNKNVIRVSLHRRYLDVVLFGARIVVADFFSVSREQ